LGPNGAGKTTLLHMIAGLAKCSDGEVTVLGEPARDNPELYRRVGVMSEHEAVYGFYTGRKFVSSPPGCTVYPRWNRPSTGQSTS